MPNIRYENNLFALIYSRPKVGKSCLLQTAPAPKLILDAEGGSRYGWKFDANGKATRVKKIWWNPLLGPPPEYDGTWESCHVFVNSYKVFESAYTWLNEEPHPFRSVGLDSLTEIQERCREAISGLESPTERQWGELLIRMRTKVREFRDLMLHPDYPLDCVIILAIDDDRKKVHVPLLQGSFTKFLGQYLDVEAYLGAFENDEDDSIERRLLITPHELYETGDRTHVLSAHYGRAISNPNITEMLDVMNADEGETVSA